MEELAKKIASETHLSYNQSWYLLKNFERYGVDMEYVKRHMKRWEFIH